jgi:hypothetical protein
MNSAIPVELDFLDLISVDTTTVLNQLIHIYYV